MAVTIPSHTPDSYGRAFARRRTALALAAALLLPQMPASALSPVTPQKPVSVSIIDRDSGRPLDFWYKDGRPYVAGRPSARYAIRVENRSAGRVLVVLSVDGVNVISGDTAALSQTGYVLGAGERYDITGWRKSDSQIAAFEFAALSGSYAARTGRPGNVGVIGMAAFLEKPQQPPAPPIAGNRYESAGEARQRAGAEPADSGPPIPAPSTTAAPASKAESSADSASSVAAAPRRAEAERLGTAHGQREWSAISHTRFERLSSTPQDVVEIAYDSYPNLMAAGVIPRRAPIARAFPKDDPRGYVPDPPQ